MSSQLLVDRPQEEERAEVSLLVLILHVEDVLLPSSYLLDEDRGKPSIGDIVSTLYCDNVHSLPADFSELLFRVTFRVTFTPGAATSSYTRKKGQT